uniref:ATP-dependent RNA helicase n=1 Tax=Panagrolaimus sp. JU765 TaxID=591449 RepID=A0AC34RJT7_9BILA
MGKKNFKKFTKPKEKIIVDDQNVNLPFEGEDEFNIEDMIEEINPNDVVIVESNGNKKRRYEKIKDLKAKEADNGPKKKKNKKDEQLKTSETDEEKSDQSDVEEDKSDKKKPDGAKDKKKKRRRSKKADKKKEADAANKDKVQKSEKVEKAEEEKGDNINQNGKNEESIETEKVEKDKFDENDVSEKPKSGKKPGVVDPSTLDLDMSAWDEFYLPSQVMDGLRKMRYTKPTEIQEKVLPEAITKRFDILGAAETGSGKTMAFCIPIAVRLLENEEKKGLRSLILAPTRELVMQIYKEMQRLLEFTPFNVIPVIGGINEQKQERLLKWNPEVIVATPGRFWALCESNAFLKSF